MVFSTLMIAKAASGAQLANIHVGNDNDYSVTGPSQPCPAQLPSSQQLAGSFFMLEVGQAGD